MLLDPGDSQVIQDAATENVSSRGVRVVLKARREPDGPRLLQPGRLLFLKSPQHKIRTSVRVVYCQTLSNGQLGVGLQVQGASVNWAERFTGKAA